MSLLLLQDMARVILTAMGVTKISDSEVEALASELLKEYAEKYAEAGKPFGDDEEGLAQYISNTKIIIGEEDDTSEGKQC